MAVGETTVLVHIGAKMSWRTIVLAIFLSTAGMIGEAQSSTGAKVPVQETQVRGYWIDPSSGLMWAARDSGKDVSWKKAIKYCRDLRVAGYSDWRLANMFELQGIYDKAANAPGLTGMHSEEPTTWHVRGNIFLTAYEWASRLDGRTGGYAYYFDFNDGKSNDDPTGWPYAFQFSSITRSKPTAFQAVCFSAVLD